MCNLVRVGLAAMVGGLVSAPLSAGPSFHLQLQVDPACAIEKTQFSNGVQPSMVVHASCNVERFSIGLSGQPEITKVTGNVREARVAEGKIAIRSGRPGKSVIVVHLARGTDVATIGSPSLSID